MATIRQRFRADGSPYWQVRYRLDGQETSTSLDDEKDAEQFRGLVDAVGGARARQVHGLESRSRSMTVAKWVAHYIENLSGVEKRTPEDYRGILKNDITPTLGLIPLDALSRDDIARWVEKLRSDGAAGKTIGNKHSLLSAALNAAVVKGHIPANPATGVRLPRTERPEMRFLTSEEFSILSAEITESWRPMIRFLVASGARLSEATALRPGDVNRAAATVRISRAWKRGGGGYHLGAPKTKRSVRTINISASVLDGLDYTGDWLFTTPGRGRNGVGGPVRAPNFRANVWWPALERAELAAPRPRIHDLRHTCASWMIAKNVPLPVIQRHLGHESIKTTVDLYGHLDRDSAQLAADVIGELLDP
jgi:integrase